MERQINLSDFLRLLKLRWATIAIIPLAAMVISGLVNLYLLKPVYQSTVTLLIQNKQQGNFEYNTVMANKELIKTYSQIASSERVLDMVIADNKLNLSFEEMSKKIRVNSVGESQIMQIQVEDYSPNLAYLLATSMGNVFTEEAKAISGLDNLRIVDKARVPKQPIKPRTIINIAIAGVAGFIGAIGLVIIREFMDGSIKEPQEVEEQFHLPVLGMMPEFKGQSVIHLTNYYSKR